VLAFVRTSDGAFQPQTVASFPRRHAKEILVADVDGDDKDELYVSLEAESRAAGQKREVIAPLEIQRYEHRKGRWRATTIGTLPHGVQARVLLAADFSGNGHKSLIVTTWQAGLWQLTPGRGGNPWKKLHIDRESSGFEHAAGAADLDGDGRAELYVAADDQDEVRRYVWRDGQFARETIYALEKSDLTWSIEPCYAPAPKRP
jgi:hypothetical protein